MINVLQRALRLVGPWARRRIMASAIFSLILAAFEMLAFGLLYVLITLLAAQDAPSRQDHALVRTLLGSGPDESLVPRVATLTITLLLLKSAAAVVLARWNAGVQSVTEAELANRLYAEYIAQDYLVHVGRNSAQLARNLTLSVGAVCTTVIGSFTVILSDGTVLVGVFITLLAVDAAVASSIGLYLAIIVAGYLLVISPIIHRASVLDNRLYADMLQTVQEGFGGIKSVQVFDVTANFALRHNKQRDRLARVRKTTIFVQRLPPYYLEACVVVGISLGAYFLVRARSEEQAFALLGLLVAAALRVLPSVNRVLQSISAIRSAGPAVDNLVPGPRSASAITVQDASLPPFQESITFDHVSFTYPNASAAALTDIVTSIPRGLAVGIVGPSGSGKTTLVDVLLGLLHPAAGRVLIDDAALTHANVAQWRRQVGYVPQDTYLMDASIFDNVLFERELSVESDAAENAVWVALEQAQLADFVRTLPQGLATRVGERGARLSGGQRQRLGIARALLRQPRVLVLDEATSALDGATEDAVAATIKKLQGHITILIIAHRLSTVRSCDRILLMEAGYLQAADSFSNLYAHHDGFRALVQRADLVGHMSSSNDLP